MLLPKLPLLRHAIFAICCRLLAAGGARPPAVGTTAQPYTAGRPTPPRRATFYNKIVTASMCQTSAPSIIRIDFFAERIRSVANL